ncbi:MAG: ParB N-terminal domain-containing protein [Flavobacteriales bacterium]|nr:ParB N-terminal domain-containing protein [Flavobacteriales bacterium]
MAKKSFLNPPEKNAQIASRLKNLSNLDNILDEVTSDDSENVEPKQNVSKIHYSKVKNRSNIREEYFGIEHLANSIHEHGLINPITLTKDGYLIAGHRRLKAFEWGAKNIDGFDPHVLFTLKEQNSKDIDDDQWELLQLAENEERQGLDNFDLALLYKRKIDEQGWTQKDIQLKYNKTKGFVSNILKINSIPVELKKLLKEFQEYAWSYKKYTAVYSEGLSEKDELFYEKERGQFGWKTLYEIALKKTLEDKVTYFLKKYGSRLTDSEKNSDFFKKYTAVYSNEIEKNRKLENLNKLKNGIKSVEKTVEKLGDFYDKSDIRKLLVDIQTLQEQADTMLKEEEARLKANQESLFPSNSTSTSTKQVLTTTPFIYSYDNKDLDLSEIVNKIGYKETLYSIADIISVMSIQKKPLKNLKSLITSNINKNFALKHMPDDFNQDKLNPEIEDWIIKYQAMPLTRIDNHNFSEDTIAFINSFYQDRYNRFNKN